jgi:hypothetical protein
MTIKLNGQQLAAAGTPARARTIPEQIAKIFSEPPPTCSAKNIQTWESYLPHDCVQSMIYMGWDRST